MKRVNCKGVGDNNGFIEIESAGASRAENIVSPQIFLININWHPEIDVIANWCKYTLKEYMTEFKVDCDCINEMMEAGAIKLMSG